MKAAAIVVFVVSTGGAALLDVSKAARSGALYLSILIGAAVVGSER